MKRRITENIYLTLRLSSLFSANKTHISTLEINKDSLREQFNR